MYHISQRIALFAGPLLMGLVLILPNPEGISPEMKKVMAMALWMLVWWISEALPLSVTALLPLILLPLLGVYEKMGEVSLAYANPIIFLFLGGFMLALALEKWNLHRRIALNIVSWTGTRADGIILGFMLATAFLSMWISNTATTVMMLPIAASIIQVLERDQRVEPKKMARFSLTLMLGIAYSANIGGVATIVGTPPNSVLASLILDQYGYEISFANWLIVGLPFSLILLGLCYLILVKIVYPNQLGHFAQTEVLIQSELKKLGPMPWPEQATLWVFISTASLWVFRGQINQLFPGLHLSDPLIAMGGTIVLFIFPVQWSEGKFILDWPDTQRLPWGILLLFGGGIALAGALDKVGIIQMIGNTFQAKSDLNTFWIVALLTLLVMFMTEVMSNVALVTVMIPVVGGIALALGENPLTLCIPITMAASCAFMLPMSTPPNAIVFASGHIKVSQMLRAGIWLNLVSILWIVFIWYWLLPYAFGIQLGMLPDWL